MEESLEERFLHACKVGDIESVRLALSLNVDVNYQQGWGLRRAVRYNHPQIWDSLLLHGYIQVNLTNEFGLTALHTACRFNIPSAVTDLLRHPFISVNEKTKLGSSPLMVAVKYARRQAIEILIRDQRVDLETVDAQNRHLEDVIGVAVDNITEDESSHLFEIIQEERRKRSDDGRRNSLDEEGLTIDGHHRSKVFDKLKELLDELEELHKREIEKVQETQEQDSLQFQLKMEQDLAQFLMEQDQERIRFMERITSDKEMFNTRQQQELERLLKKQEEESAFLQGSSGRCPEFDPATSPRPSGQSSGSRRASVTLYSGDRIPHMASTGSSTSPWDLSTPDEGYLTSKDTELPDMIQCERRELECPICLEVMSPTNRVWQCQVGHRICDSCQDMVWREAGSSSVPCPVCKTAPFIGI